MSEEANVYIITNIITGQQYIGASEKDDPNYYGSSDLVKRDIKNIGKEKFIKEILEYCKPGRDLINKEKKYIIEYNTLYPNGYNKNLGGGLSTIASKERKLNENMKKRFNPDGTWTQYEKDRVRLLKRKKRIKLLEELRNLT
jgi:hypothetical protein